MTGLGRRARCARVIDDLGQSSFASRPQIQVVLEQLALQRPAVDAEAGLQFLMGKRRRLGSGEKADQPGIQLLRAAKARRLLEAVTAYFEPLDPSLATSSASPASALEFSAAFAARNRSVAERT